MVSAYSSATAPSGTPANSRMRAQRMPVRSLPAEQCTRHFSLGLSRKNSRACVKAGAPDSRISVYAFTNPAVVSVPA